MDEHRLADILNRAKESKILVIGDMGLDIYWRADMRKSKLSRENPFHYVPIVGETTSLGGGGNLTNCLATLCPNVSVISVLDEDWKGREIIKLLEEAGVNTENIITSPLWKTVAYAKIRRRGLDDHVVYEDPHLYFENHSELPQEIEEQIIERLKREIVGYDYVFVTDYREYSVMTKRIRQIVSEHGKNGKTIVVDSRDHLLDYSHITAKPNDIELENASADKNAGHIANMKTIYENQHLKNICATFGKEGAICYSGDTFAKIPTNTAYGEIDTVGAGDAFGAAFICALSTGQDVKTAAYIGNLAAYVVIHKIGTTGTATVKEILSANDPTNLETESHLPV